MIDDLYLVGAWASYGIGGFGLSYGLQLGLTMAVELWATIQGSTSWAVDGSFHLLYVVVTEL